MTEMAQIPGDGAMLRGRRVGLRRFEQDERHQELVRSVVTDSLIPHITTVPHTPDVGEVRAFIDRQIARFSLDAGFSFCIADRASDQPMGQIGLWTKDVGSGRATTGYWVAPAYRQRGVLVDALDLLTRWALSIPEVERVSLYVEPWNVGSWRAAEKVGYRREGVLRGWEKIAGVRKDTYSYGVLASDRL